MGWFSKVANDAMEQQERGNAIAEALNGKLPEVPLEEQLKMAKEKRHATEIQVERKIYEIVRYFVSEAESLRRDIEERDQCRYDYEQLLHHMEQ